MIVAWQFIARNAFTGRIRPVGNGMIDVGGRLVVRDQRTRPHDPITPHPTGRVTIWSDSWQQIARLTSFSPSGTKLSPLLCDFPPDPALADSQAFRTWLSLTFLPSCPL